eukprot:3980062-Prymnesium_polylepis.1
MIIVHASNHKCCAPRWHVAPPPGAECNQAPTLAPEPCTRGTGRPTRVPEAVRSQPKRPSAVARRGPGRDTRRRLPNARRSAAATPLHGTSRVGTQLSRCLQQLEVAASNGVVWIALECLREARECRGCVSKLRGLDARVDEQLDVLRVDAQPFDKRGERLLVAPKGGEQEAAVVVGSRRARIGARGGGGGHVRILEPPCLLVGDGERRECVGVGGRQDDGALQRAGRAFELPKLEQRLPQTNVRPLGTLRGTKDDRVAIGRRRRHEERSAVVTHRLRPHGGCSPSGEGVAPRGREPISCRGIGQWLRSLGSFCGGGALQSVVLHVLRVEEKADQDVAQPTSDWRSRVTQDPRVEQHVAHVALENRGSVGQAASQRLDHRAAALIARHGVQRDGCRQSRAITVDAQHDLPRARIVLDDARVSDTHQDLVEPLAKPSACSRELLELSRASSLTCIEGDAAGLSPASVSFCLVDDRRALMGREQRRPRDACEVIHAEWSMRHRIPSVPLLRRARLLAGDEGVGLPCVLGAREGL